MPRMNLQWAGGVNRLVDARAVADNQIIKSKNTYCSLEGILDKREPVRGVGNFICTGSDTGGGGSIRPITLFVPDPVLGLDLIAHLSDSNPTPVGSGEFFAGLSLGQSFAYKTTDSNAQAIVVNQLSQPASFTNYRGRVIGVTAGTEGFKQLSRDNTGNLNWSSVTFKWDVGVNPISQVQGVPVYPRVVGTYRGRLIFANFGPGMENWMVFADRDTQTGWGDYTTSPPWAVVGDDVLTANGKHLEIIFLQGEEITGLKEVGLQAVGSPLSVGLLVLTKRKGVICTGEVAQTTDTDFATNAGYIADFQANAINFEVGLVGPNCMCQTPYGLVWASDDQVWLMNGNTPMRMGGLIRTALRNTPPALRKYWSMAYANGIVFLSIATQSSVNELQQTVNHWRLDLRNGLPDNELSAKWFGPQDYEGLPDLAKGGGTQGEGEMTCALVSIRKETSDIVYGAIRTRSNTNMVTVISFNEGMGGDDMPWFPAQSSGRVWSGDDNREGNVIPLGDVTRPSVYKNNGRMYLCVVSGIPGPTEPVWPIVDSGTVIDGGVTWAEIQWATLGVVPPRLPSYAGGTHSSSFLVDVLFKDLQFGNSNRDKLLRRVDINAYFSFKSLMAMRVICDQGRTVKIMGPTTIGGGDDTETDIGLALLDQTGLVREFQSRSLRPGYTVARLAADPINYYDALDTGGWESGGVVRGNNLQPRFTDDDGLIIDGTNDRISWCTYGTGKPSTIQQVWSTQLTHGRYANVDALLTQIVLQMNAAQGLITNFTVGVNPWSFESAYFGAESSSYYPYMVNIKFAFAARGASGPDPYAIAIVFGNPVELDEPTTLLGTTCYPSQTKRLLALLGFDTTESYRLASGMTEVFSDSSEVQFCAEQESPILTSPTRINGIQSIPYTRSPVVSISGIELEYFVKPGLPFSKISR